MFDPEVTLVDTLPMIGTGSLEAYARMSLRTGSRVRSPHIRSNVDRSRMFTFDPESINSSTQCSLVVTFLRGCWLLFILPITYTYSLLLPPGEAGRIVC